MIDKLKKAFNKFCKDIQKAKWVILGILFFYILLMQITYSTCPTIMLTGIPCPFCGMTRAGIALLHFDLKKAYQLNPMIFGILVIALVFFYIRYFTEKDLSCMRPVIISFLIISIGVYVYRMFSLFPDQWPMLYYEHNYLSGVLGWHFYWY